MEKLLRIAEKVADEAEVFATEGASGSLSIEGGNLTEISGGLGKGYALRILKGGRVGSSYTKNLLDREGLLKNALASLKGRVKAGFSFPETTKVKRIDLYDRRIESLSASKLYERAEAVYDFFEGKVRGQVNVYSGFVRERKEISNTNGLERSSRRTAYYIIASVIYPKSSTHNNRTFAYPSLKDPPTKELQAHADEYQDSLPVVSMGSGKVPVLFKPNAQFPILWRLTEAASAKNIHEKTSPLTGKLGKRVVSERFSMYNDPLDEESVSATAFDDEGVATRRLDVIKDGRFSSCYANLDYAAKLGMEPTGTGFRSAPFFPGDPVTIQPAPLLNCLSIARGKEKYLGMLESIKKGVVAKEEMGAHSGNILNGDFSVSLTPGYVVKDGEVVGRVKDGMVAGNVYDILQRVVGVEDRCHEPGSMNANPCILVEGVAVSAK